MSKSVMGAGAELEMTVRRRRLGRRPTLLPFAVLGSLTYLL